MYVYSQQNRWSHEEREKNTFFYIRGRVGVCMPMVTGTLRYTLHHIMHIKTNSMQWNQLQKYN